MPPLICVVRSPRPLRNCSSTSQTSSPIPTQPAEQRDRGGQRRRHAALGQHRRQRLQQRGEQQRDRQRDDHDLDPRDDVQHDVRGEQDREDPPRPGGGGPHAGRDHGGVDRADPGQPALLAAGLLPLRPVPGGRLLRGVLGRVRRAGQPGGVGLLGRGGLRRVARGLALARGHVGRPAGRAGPGRVVARRWGRVGGAGRPVHGPPRWSGSVVVWPVWPTRAIGGLRPTCWKTGRRDRAVHAAGDGRGLERGPQVRAVVPGRDAGAGGARRRRHGAGLRGRAGARRAAAHARPRSPRSRRSPSTT